MKKFLGVLFAVILLFGLSACSLFGGKNEENGGNNSNGGNSIFNSTKTLTCTKTEVDDDGDKTDATLTVTYKNDIIKKIVSTELTSLDAEYIEFAISFGKAAAEEFNKVNGLNISYTADGADKLKIETVIDYDSLDLDALASIVDDLAEEGELENSFYKSKELKIEDIQKEMIEDGYTCK